MKHIKQKFEFEMSDAEFNKSLHPKKAKEILINTSQDTKIGKDQAAFFKTDEGMWIRVFQHKIDKKSFTIPEPSPILIYFNNAQIGYRGIADSKTELIKSLDFTGVDKIFTTEIGHKLYAYMFHATGCVLFLFTAIETMINKTIPPSISFAKKANRFTEVYDYEQIQRHLSFDIKLTEVLPMATGKSFEKSHPTKYQLVKNLKEFRDTIMHTKTALNEHTPYSHIFKTALSFNYEETILAVKELINFYHPNLVEQCTCGKDF